MEAFSQDLRKRIVQAVKTTGNQTQVAITFQVSRSTVRRYLKLEKHDTELTPKKDQAVKEAFLLKIPPALRTFLKPKTI